MSGVGPGGSVVVNPLTLNLLTTTIVAPPSNASKWQMGFNLAFKGLNAKLNPTCHLLALLGTHHILHVSRVRVPASIPGGDTGDFFRGYRRNHMPRDRHSL